VSAAQATLAARGVAPGDVRTESYWLDRAAAPAA